MTPAILWDKLKKKWDRRYTLSFLSVWIFGLLAHLFKFMNALPNYDSLTSYHDPQNKIMLGRCFLTIPCTISSFYEVPWVIALLSLLYISGACCCIVALLDIRKKLAVIMTGAFLVTFPAVTCTFSFMYTADGYFMALFCVSLAILLITRQHLKGLAPAALLICFAFGIYQAYAMFAMVLTLVYLMKRIVFDRSELKRVYADAGWTLAAGGVGAGVYFICYHVLMRLEKTELRDYQGMSDLAFPGIAGLVEGAKRAVKSFLRFFFYSEQGISLYTILNVLIFLILFIVLLTLFIRKKELHDWKKVLTVLVSAGLIIVCTYIYYFISASVLYHTTMLECLALIYVLFAVVYDHAEQLGHRSILSWSVLIVSALMIYYFILLANICYLGMSKSFQSTMSIATRMMNRMEQLEDYDQAEQLAVIGRLENTAETTYNFPPDMTGIIPYYVMRVQEEYVQLFNLYEGTDFTEAGDETVTEIMQTQEYLDMNCWPQENSIAVIGDVMVIKFEDEMSFVEAD